MNKNYIIYIKSPADFLLAIVLIIVLMPLWLILGAFLFFANRGKIFFTQERVGKNNKPFNVIKFKSMNDKRDEDGMLLPNEQRMTKIGKFIRATSLDELPQLLNVLKRDMSFIGPRPLHVRYLPYYSEEEGLRHSVRPGITGLAQVSGRNKVQWEEKLKMDVSYVKKIGLFMDLKILVLTIKKIFDSSDVVMVGFEGLDEYRERIKSSR